MKVHGVPDPVLGGLDERDRAFEDLAITPHQLQRTQIGALEPAHSDVNEASLLDLGPQLRRCMEMPPRENLPPG